jgi:hypothetical protein
LPTQNAGAVWPLARHADTLPAHFVSVSVMTGNMGMGESRATTGSAQRIRRSNADCVLTDAPMQCNACNFARLYPALRTVSMGPKMRANLVKIADGPQISSPSENPSS